MAIIPVTNPGSGNDIRPNLQTAINTAAASGDIIELPVGSFTYSSTITTTKRFTLRSVSPAIVQWNGFAANYNIESNSLQWISQPSTIIYRSEATTDASLSSVPMIRFNDSAGSPQITPTTDGVIISDIEFRSKLPSQNGYPANGGPTPPADNLSLAADYALYFNKSVDFKITRCRFKYFGYAAIRYDHWDSVSRGLIYKCDFDANSKGADGLGLGYGIVVYGQNLTWLTNPQFGSDNFLFIENCTFNLHRHSTSGGGCGRYVIRYSYIQDNIVTYFNSCQAIDAHGRRAGSLGSGNYFATHTVEAYNNKIINQYKYDPTHTSQKILLDGSSVTGDLIESAIRLKESFHLSYNNIIKGYRFGSAVQVEEINVYNDGNTGYPQKYTFGEPSAITGGSGTPNGDLGDSWIWNNTVHLLNGQCFNFYNYTPSIFTQDRDYHLSSYAYLNADSTGSGTAYTYPHPNRDDLQITNVGRTYRVRLYHTR